MQKEQLDFGRGSFVGEIMREPEFFELDPRNQARILAWADSCPVVTELTDPENHNPGRGPEAMLGRYGEINFWFGEISRAVGETNLELYELLMQPVKRLPEEPIGKYEPESIPAHNLEEIAPMGTLAGYALPRLFVEQLGGQEDLTLAQRQDRLLQGWNELEKAVAVAKNPLELLALFSEGLACHASLSPEKVLKCALNPGWLEEHNAHTVLAEFKALLPTRAPKLHEFYAGLSEEDKKRLKFA